MKTKCETNMEPTLIQEDNLLRFLNHAEEPEELICSLGEVLGEDAEKVAQQLLDARQELGAYLDLGDLYAVTGETSPLTRSLLNAATRTFFLPEITPNLLSFDISGQPVVLLGPGMPFFFPLIKWEKVPPKWVRLVNFLIALSSKRLDLTQRKTKADARLDQLNHTLNTLKNTKPVDEEGIAEVKRRIKAARTKQKMLQREIDALNKLVKKRDLKGVFCHYQTQY